jgi:hypothetical protein
VPPANVQPQRSPTAGRRQGAERQRLLSLAARIGRRRQWWAAQRDAASVRVDALTAELAAAAAKVDALEAEPAEIGR